MAGRGLDDNAVAQEMNKMVSFIKQEALEKAREIKVKGDEEFNIEKAKLVRQETLAIEAFYEKKKKQAEVQRKIAQSNHINKSRLRVLQARQEVLNDIFTEARGKLATLTKDPKAYSKLLADSIAEGLYKLMDDEVTVQCRKADTPLAKAAAAEASKQYSDTFKRPVKVTIDEANPLPDSSAGGVVISSMEGRVRCDNTLERRLDSMAETMMPGIRLQLFGVSPNRAFFN
ncbi:hypothetical protein SmJEL517_g00908 [Synchytrium microbalum]|uniref:ATP synthase (E/31 kDa) subunit n=1 Tax=Synchytrium microbalum TaxID=1806994 RepID=A0A507C680_9FUNG|nr:uncharacterized protein SmJEL517_g00908 [Synchytrium microbalum]TPX37100.1 hypothetical protein SmJEL517_g00908 [Synchytrium microbalum]